MAFKRVQFGSSRFGSMRRSMSNSRLLFTAITWFFALTMVYSSLFYVPAFYDFKQAFGIANTNEVSVKPKKESIFTPYINLLNQNRTFLRQGQGMEAVYAVSRGSNAELVFYACEAPPVVEVFRCNPKIVQRHPIRKTSGRYAIKVQNSGFYAFDIIVSDPEKPYKVVWQRRY